MKRLLLLLAVILAIPVSIWAMPAPPVQQVAAQVVSFRESFDGDPGAPESFLRQPWYARWDVAVHGRDNRYQLRDTPHASHGLNCSGPPASHDTGGQFDAAVYQCKDHVMTAVHPDGYGLTYLTPGAMVDFSQGGAVIEWRMSTLRTSERDWIDVWISPYADNLQLPLNPGFPDLQGPPRRAVQVLMSNEHYSLCPEVWRDGIAIEDNQSPYRCRQGAHYTDVLTPDAARRDRFQIWISKTHIKVGMPDYNLWWYDYDLRQPLDWSQGVVQFGQHSYSPEKGVHITDPATGVAGPNTWHWDDVLIQPAVPFSIVHTNRRVADAGAPTLLFDRPTPANSMLRFSAWGTGVEFSTNAGVTWQRAQRAVQGDDDSHIFNYWTPINAGASQVIFRAGQWAGGAWQVKDVAVWSSSQEVPPSTPTATPTPPTTPAPSATTGGGPPSLSPSPTPLPTSTAVIEPSATPTVAATATALPSETPEPTPADPSATPLPDCLVYVRLRGGPPEWIDCAVIRGGGP